LDSECIVADVIAVLSDHVAGYTKIAAIVTHRDWAQAPLRAPLGVYAILGSHDWWLMRLRRRWDAESNSIYHGEEGSKFPIYRFFVLKLLRMWASIFFN
jgi:predicted MPP superfamily phosphohydrolase